MDRAWESNDPTSIEDALLPQRSLHFISGSLLQAEPFLPYLSFRVLKTFGGSSSSPRTTIFCKEELILLQSWQQNHLPFGTSCSSIWKHQCFNPKEGLHVRLILERYNWCWGTVWQQKKEVPLGHPFYVLLSTQHEILSHTERTQNRQTLVHIWN